jgi:phosphoglycerol transferase MdoB-like AlkP superfamily enzyme
VTKWQQELKIQILGTDFTRLAVAQYGSELSPKLDLSIEGMRSQQWSEGIFAFLLVGIVVFIGIVIAFMFSKKRSEKIKLGERMMFAAIILGVVVAITFGAVQMLGGYLF